MFDMYLSGNGAGMRNVRKALTLSLSLLFHALLIAAIIVVPLLRAEARLPECKFTDVLIAPPILPGVPPGPGRGGKTQAGPAAAPKGPKNPSPIVKPRGFMTPVEIPTTITDENLIDLVPQGRFGPVVIGSPGDDSAGGSILGQDFPLEEVKPFEKMVTTIRPPRLIKRVNPDYSPAAIAAHVSGPVVIEAVTDIYGRVREARVVSGHALLSMSALEAIRKWIYEPYLVNGMPKPVSFKVTVTFTLDKR
jgi:protein TonB